MKCKFPVGISSCLLGERVRWNGEHRLAHSLVAAFTPFFDWIAICPEVDVGMGVPREKVRLVQRLSGVRMLGVDSRKDWTEALERLTTELEGTLTNQGLCGYIFKENSPSCGVDKVPVHDLSGLPQASGKGLFAALLLEKFPRLPVAEAMALETPVRQQTFLEQVHAYALQQETKP